MEALAFGKYQLVEQLAEGGMAVVWRARVIGPGGFQKEFCVKQIRADMAERREFVELFVAEAKLTVSLTHANIVPVYELGMVDGTYFLALELIDGPPLTQLLDKGPLPAPLAAYIVEQVLRGLDYAHRRGVVHRDLSPANVLVSRDGEVKIVDFGIAHPLDGPGRGVQGGSRGYMAPEQERHEKVDGRADLYAVGVLLHELLSGRRFGAGPLGDDAPEVLARVVARATAPDREERHPDAAAMLAHVSRFLRDMSMGPTQSELSSFVRRRCPDVVRRPVGADAGDPTRRSGPVTALADGTRATGPQTVPLDGARAAGPSTAPVDPGRSTGKQVTFATRIELEDAAARRSRTRYVLGLVGALSLALVSTGVVWMRGRAGASGAPDVAAAVSSTPSPPPAPPAAAPAPAPPVAVAHGRLGVETSPPGVEVRLGERLLGSTPLEAEVPLDAPLSLHLRKRGYQPLDRTLAPARFAGTPPRASLSERLQPLPKGELTLNALPWAHVTIDGEARPDTPIQHLPLTAGPHQVRLQCPPTGRELKFTVVIEASAEARKLADLRSEPRLVE